MLKRGLFAVAASSLLAQAAFGYHAELSFDELRQRCHELASNNQILPFTASLTCSEERTFWVKTGELPIPLGNHSEVRIKAQIKDCAGANQTDWWQLEVPVAQQEAVCETAEQWTTMARSSHTLTCADLDSVASEQDFCRGQLQPIWDECDANREQGMLDGSSSSSAGKPMAGACEFVRTGAVKGCAGTLPQPVVPPVVMAPTTTLSSLSSMHGPSVSSLSSVSVPHHHHHHVPSVSMTSVSVPKAPYVSMTSISVPKEPSVSMTSVSVPKAPVYREPSLTSVSVRVLKDRAPSFTTISVTAPPEAPIDHLPPAPIGQQQDYPQQQDQGQQQAYGYNLGAELQEKPIRKGIFKHLSNVVELLGNPAHGSVLANCGFNKGDKITKIGKMHISKVSDLHKMLTNVAPGKALKVKYRDANGKTYEKSVYPNAK